MRQLFPDHFAKRLGNLSISTKSRQFGHHKGTHRSSKLGMSLDFSDFREYHPGDDVRHIDWNVFARTEKPFIKQFLDEQEMRVHIVLDSTKSMQNDEKWDFARQLAIALSHIALKSGDTVSFSAWDDDKSYIFRRKGAKQRVAFTRYISQLEQLSVSTSFASEVVKHAPKAMTVLFVITDGLEPLEHWEQLFRRLRGVCRDVRIVTVHSESYDAADYAGDLRLIDSESEQFVEVTMTESVRETYKHRKQAHENGLQVAAKKYGIELLKVHVQDGAIDTITKRMRSVGWIR